MKFGFLMAGGYATSPATDGRKSQIHYQADALERIGHQVVRLNPWESYDLTSLDALHIVEAGLGNILGLFGRIPDVKKMGMATFIDTTSNNSLYRLLTLAGDIHPRFLTQQGIFRRQARNCDVVIARSRDEVRLLTKGIGINPHKVKIVLNGVNPPGNTDVEGVRQQFALTEDFALHISMFTQARKNVVNLIHAAGQAQIPLVIGGTAPAGESHEVYAVAQRYPQIKFIGRLTNLQRDSLYAACRIFCLPSIYEGTGLVALEAASHGAAVVITKNGGPPDYFADLADYADPASIPSIADAIQRAWARGRTDPRLQNHVLQNLSWDASAQSLAAAYGPTA